MVAEDAVAIAVILAKGGVVTTKRSKAAEGLGSIVQGRGQGVEHRHIGGPKQSKECFNYNLYIY